MKQGMSEMPRPIRLNRLPRNRPHTFDETADETERAAIAAHLAVRDIGRLRVTGYITPVGTADWQLSARLTTTVVQACVVTLDDVAMRLDLNISRHYIEGLVEEAGEVDLDSDPEADDEAPEALPEQIDLGAIAIEETGLALDPYPRRKDAVLDPPAEADEAEDDTHRPFADLAALAARLNNKS